MITIVSLPRRLEAFSLVELMVTLAVLAMVASLGAPSFRELVQSWQLRSEAAQMISAIWLARGTALRSGQKTILCPLEEKICGGRYQEGFAVVTEEGALLHQYQSRRGISITNRRGTQAESRVVAWGPDGLGSRNMTFLFCAKNAQVNWSVVLNRTGRPRLRRGWGICPP
ncbi:MAG: GspH/FimT family pseudopilin [Luminiphilus sp.]|jgi:type IV fimbrial biogenesis protein FimT|nr:GspH/FimT family pseudopilin [Luminiphilus sp.]MDG1460622.1 GspH/FimT family pseudopilin [Luminiphilus sp.]